MLEVRQALEPWHVMGEEGAPGGTVRYVDSSVERLQIKLSGLTDTRYVVACNGKRVPLTPTGPTRRGGRRCSLPRVASLLIVCIPTSGLTHPSHLICTTVGLERAVAGCTYHVAHQGGRNFEQFPVNAYEAESRRLARFTPFGHTAGPYVEPVRYHSSRVSLHP